VGTYDGGHGKTDGAQKYAALDPGGKGRNSGISEEAFQVGRFMFDNLRVKLTAAAVGVLFVISCAYAFDLFSELGVIRPKVRVEAPGFTLASLGGGDRSLEEFKGKVILLNFWATHCEPCREEMPAMERLWREMKKRGLVIIAVAADRGSPKKVEEFCKTTGVTFPVLLDPEGDVRRTYEVTVLPMSYIIGRDGKFIGKVIGEREWDGRAAFEFFEDLLK
jgi:peroxiredoxin